MEYTFGTEGRPIDRTGLRNNEFYMRYYYHYAYFVVHFGLPMIVLSTLNCIIYRQV